MPIASAEAQIERLRLRYAYQSERQEAQAQLPTPSFREFLDHWQFSNRETGALVTLGESLWSGQEQFVKATEEHRWIFALKAGKLGFTEIEAAFDAYVLRFRQPNARVNVFSMNMASAQELRRYIAFGLQRLPDAWRLPFATDEPGADTTTSIRLQAGPADVRTLVCYPSSPNASIDVSAQHTHLDEFCRMPYPRSTFSAVESTITDVPESTCHIVSRGNGADNYGADIWQRALMGSSRFYPFFTPWTERAGRDQEWYEQEQAEHDAVQLAFFAPETWEEAVAGPGIDGVVPMEWASGAMEQERRAAGGGTLVAGLDVARYGHDKTAFIYNSDTDVVGLDEWQGLGTTETTAKVLEYIRRYEIVAIAVDDTGVGGGVTDELVEADVCLVVPVNFGASALDKDRFHNRVSEIWWGMREAFDPESDLPLSLPSQHPLSPKLVNQTQGRRYKYDRGGGGRIWVFRSDGSEGEHVPSPDLADALALSLEAWRAYWAQARDTGRRIHRGSWLG